MLGFSDGEVLKEGFILGAKEGSEDRLGCPLGKVEGCILFVGPELGLREGVVLVDGRRVGKLVGSGSAALTSWSNVGVGSKLAFSEAFDIVGLMEGIIDRVGKLGFELASTDGARDGCREVDGRMVGASILSKKGMMTPII